MREIKKSILLKVVSVGIAICLFLSNAGLCEYLRIPLLTNSQVYSKSGYILTTEKSIKILLKESYTIIDKIYNLKAEIKKCSRNIAYGLVMLDLEKRKKIDKEFNLSVSFASFMGTEIMGILEKERSEFEKISFIIESNPEKLLESPIIDDVTKTYLTSLTTYKKDKSEQESLLKDIKTEFKNRFSEFIEKLLDFSYGELLLLEENIEDICYIANSFWRFFEIDDRRDLIEAIRKKIELKKDRYYVFFSIRQLTQNGILQGIPIPEGILDEKLVISLERYQLIGLLEYRLLTLRSSL